MMIGMYYHMFPPAVEAGQANAVVPGTPRLNNRPLEPRVALRSVARDRPIRRNPVHL